MFIRLATLTIIMLAACGAPQKPEPAPRSEAPKESGALYLPPGFEPTTNMGAPEADDGAQTTGADREPTEREWDALIKLARKAESLRGLTFKTTPEVRVQTAAVIGSHLSSETDDAEMQRETKRLLALGLLDPELDLRRAKEVQAQTGVLGYYDPVKKRLVVRDDVAVSLTRQLNMREVNQNRSTIVHELVHALQDQHFDLERGRKARTTFDGQNAYAALVEGDASLVTVQWAYLRAGYDIASVMSNRALFEPIVQGTMGRPFGLYAQLHNVITLRYVAGAQFAAALHFQGGWARVNRAYDAPPETAAQVLDPSRYFRGVGLDRIQSCAKKPLESAGFQVLEEEVLGQLLVAAYLSSAGLNAAAVSDSWRGDRFWLVERGEKLGFAWIMTFEAESNAVHADQFMIRVMRNHELNGQTVHAHVKGRALLVTRDLGDGLRTQLERMLPRCVGARTAD